MNEARDLVNHASKETGSSVLDGSRVSLPSFVYVVGGVMALALIVLALLRHWHFLSQTFDMGFYIQDVWLIAHGQWHNSIYGFHIFADHFSPVLVLLFWTAFLPTAETLLVIQAIAVASGVIPAYRLGCRLGSARTGNLAVIWYSLSTPVWFATLYDFHPVILGVPLLLWLIAAVELGRPFVHTVLLGSALALIREDMAVFAGVILLLGSIRRRSPRLAYLAVLISMVGVSYIVWQHLSPMGMGGWHFWTRFSDVAAPEGATSIPNSIVIVGRNLTRPMALAAAAMVLLPLLVVFPLQGWRVSWPGFAILVINGTSSFPPQSTPYYQYYAPAVPFLIWGALLAPRVSGEWARMVFRVSAIVSAAVFLLLGPFVFVKAGPPDRFASTILASGERRQLQEVVDKVPPNASVSATDFLLPHLAERPVAYPFHAPMVCAISLTFYAPETVFPQFVAVEWAHTLPGRDWPSLLRSWGYVETWSDGSSAVWQLRNRPPPPTPCLSIEEVLQELALSEANGVPE